VFSLDFFFICWFRISLFSRVFIVEEGEGIGNKGLGYTMMVDVQTLLEAFLNMSLRSAGFIDEVFFW
jgi:hypothetical protein